MFPPIFFSISAFIITPLHIYKCNRGFLKKVMDKVGIIKEFDKLGRLVISKELRDRYDLDKRVEIVAAKDGVLIRNSEFTLIKTQNDT